MSPLKRTDTRAGSDPPSSRRAASIAGASPVTSRCHLHGSGGRGTGATRTLGGAQEARHAPQRRERAEASLCLSHPALSPASSGEGGEAGSGLSGARAAGRCSPIGLRPSFLPPPPGWRALAPWDGHLPTPLLARLASSRSLPDPDFQISSNKPRASPPAGFSVFHFAQIQDSVSVHLLYAQVYAGRRSNLAGYSHLVTTLSLLCPSPSPPRL